MKEPTNTHDKLHEIIDLCWKLKRTNDMNVVEEILAVATEAHNNCDYYKKDTK